MAKDEKEKTKLDGFMEFWDPFLCKRCKLRICTALDRLGKLGKARLMVSSRLKAQFARKNLCSECYQGIADKLGGK